MTIGKAREIGRYVIERKIGQGAMGEVYLALDYQIYRSVAIKTLRMDCMKSEREQDSARKLFLQEARITGNLSHAHIATLYDMGVHEDMPFLVMEYIVGKNLKQIIVAKDVFSLKEKIIILSQVASALHYAHQCGVLHRDIKPANIMVMENRSPMIMDFGIAGIVDRTSGTSRENLKEKGIVLMGTPYYMSPEHITNKGYDCRSDIFSLGIVAYEWLSGQKPFFGDTVKDVIRDTLVARVKPLSQVSCLDSRIEEIIGRALVLDPAGRYQNGEEFSDALELYLNKLEMEDSKVFPAYFSYDKIKLIEKLRGKYFFFSDFNKEELLTIFQLSQKRKYNKDEYIINEGATGTKMFVIISGHVSILNEVSGRRIEIERLGPGSCVGEMALIDKRERSASVVALEPTLAIAISETVLRLSNPAICLKLYKNLAIMLSEKLRANDIRYRELMCGRNSAGTSFEK